MHALFQHFTDWIDDQFDFHTYCLRKMTLRTYLALLRMEDTIRGHSFFCQAARGTVRVYLKMHDDPPTSDDDESAPDLSKLSGAERKKAKAKARKIAAKKKKEAEAKVAKARARFSFPAARRKNTRAPRTASVDASPHTLCTSSAPLGSAGRRRGGGGEEERGRRRCRGR